jgi:hypothetical protein
MTALVVLATVLFSMASPISVDVALAQEPPAAESDKDVHITFSDEDEVRVNPVWVAIAVVAALIVVVLAVAASRGGGTTVVRG